MEKFLFLVLPWEMIMLRHLIHFLLSDYLSSGRFREVKNKASQRVSNF